MKIFGQVLDTNNEPMGLANITITTGSLSGKMGTQADLDGNFVLEDSSIQSDSEFKISYVGYIPQFFKASELQGKKIKLAEDFELLSEVVINGGERPKGSANTQSENNQVNSTKIKFTEHLKKHRFTYAGIGGLAGILLIVRALKK